MRINILAGGLGGSVLDMQTDLSILHSNIEDTIEDLKDLKNKITRVNGGTHNLGVAIDGINNRIYSEETKKTNLETAAQKISTFLENTVYTDAAVARNVRQNQKDFFNDFPWMRPSEPDPEPSFWEKLADAWNDFWDAAGDIAENVINWVKENAVKLLIGVAAIVASAVIAFFAGEAFLATLAVLFVGAVVQGIIDGIISGLLSFFSGGSFWEGFGEGFADGFMWGGIFSLIGGIISTIKNAIKGLSVFDDVANIADDIVGAADDAANVVDDAAGVVDDAAGVIDDAAGAVDDVAGVADDAAGVADDAAGVVDDAAGAADDALSYKDVDNTLTDVQKSRLDSVDNAIKDLDEDHITAAIRDLKGDPVVIDGKVYNHLEEVRNNYRCLQKAARSLENSLKNPNLSEIDRKLLQEGLERAVRYMKQVEAALTPYGGI